MDSKATPLLVLSSFPHLKAYIPQKAASTSGSLTVKQ
jgi:hypothetical protein